MSIASTIRETARLFQTQVWPTLRDQRWVGAELHLGETCRCLACIWLDRAAGIDALVYRRGEHPSPIAVRVQPDIGYRTFTLRLGPCRELEKLRRAELAGLLRPRWHIHAYLDEKSRLVAAGVILTDDLLRAADTRWAYRTSTRDGSAEFLVVPWDRLARYVERYPR